MKKKPTKNKSIPPYLQQLYLILQAKNKQTKKVNFISDLVFCESFQTKFTIPEQYKYVTFLNLTFPLPASLIYPAEVFRQIGIDVG